MTRQLTHGIVAGRQAVTARRAAAVLFLGVLVTGCGGAVTSAPAPAAPSAAPVAASVEPTPSPEPTPEPEPTEAARADIEVLEQGYTVFDEDTPYVSFGVVLENANPSIHVGAFVTVTVTLLGADGEVITTQDELVRNALPGQRFATGGTMFDSDGVESMEVAVSTDWTEIDFGVGHFTFDKVRYRSDEYESRATGTVKCTFDEDPEDVSVVAIFRSKADKIVGGDTTYVDTVRCDKGSAFEVTSLGRLGRASKAEMFATP